MTYIHLKQFKEIKWLPTNSTIDLYKLDKIKKEKNFIPDIHIYGKTTAVFCFIYDNQDNIIILEHANKKRGLEIPGGHVEDGETLETAIKREIMEEVGVSILNLLPIGIQVIKKDVSEDKYPDLLSNQLFYSANLKKIKDIELAEDSIKMIKMKISDFREYLNSKNNYYIDLLNYKGKIC